MLETEDVMSSVSFFVIASEAKQSLYELYVKLENAMTQRKQNSCML